MTTDTAPTVRRLERPRECWHVVYTSPRAEKRAAERLAADGFTVFLPLYKDRRKWSDRIKTVEVPLYSSYVFVRCLPQRIHTAVVTPGVARVVYHNRKPAVIRESEIEAIREFLELAESNRIITPGDRVEIDCGPLQKVSGKVIRLNRKMAYLYIEALSATVYVQLEQVRKTVPVSGGSGRKDNRHTEREK